MPRRGDPPPPVEQLIICSPPAALFIASPPAAACPDHTRPDHRISTTTEHCHRPPAPGTLRSDRAAPEIDDASRLGSRPRPRPRPRPCVAGQPHVLHHHRLLLPGFRALDRRAQLRRRRAGVVRAAPVCRPAAEGGAGHEDVHVSRERRQRRGQAGPGAHRLRRLPRGRHRGQRRGRRRRRRRRRPQEAPAVQGPGRRPRGVLQDAQHAQPQAEDGAGEPAGAAAAAGGGVVPEPPRPHQAEADGGGLRVHEALVRAAGGAEQAPREGGGRAPRAQGRARPAGLPRRHAHHVPLLPPRRRRRTVRHAAPAPAAAAAAVPPQAQRAARRQRPAKPLPVLPVHHRRPRPVRPAAGRVERRRAAARHQRALLRRRDLAAGVQSGRLIRRFGQAAVDWVNQLINWQISQSIAARGFDLVWFG